MKEQEEVRAVSQFFKILSDPTRLKILMFLGWRAQCFVDQ